MNKFSPASQARLNTCHPDLIKLFETVLQSHDCTIIQGMRSKKTQDEYFRTGRSKLKWPDSKHNSEPSNAVDVAPYPIDWSNTKRFYYFAGIVKGHADMMGIKIRWGGDWNQNNNLDDQTFFDLVHFEIAP